MPVKNSEEDNDFLILTRTVFLQTFKTGTIKTAFNWSSCGIFLIVHSKILDLFGICKPQQFCFLQ